MDGTESRLVKAITACRVCQSFGLDPILDFGAMPLANRYLSETDLPPVPEMFAPLAVVLCSNCGCVQLAHTVDPKLLFEDYCYTSSTSGSLAEHFNQYARDTVEKLLLEPGKDFIVGIGGNDGPLEKAYQSMGFKVLNVEASYNIAKLSQSNGVPTFHGWFNEDTANAIVRDYGYASLITCNNCFAHIPDIHGVVRAIKVLLKSNGWFVCENAYWLDTIRGNHFDQIYHEHVFYWTIRALDNLFRLQGLGISNVEFNKSQGGSIRVFVKRELGVATLPLYDEMRREEACGLFKPSTYANWSRLIECWKSTCQVFLQPLESVCCYGVPAKFTMIAEQLRFAPHRIRYAVDDSPIKVGKFTPGSHIPIVDRQHFLEHPTEHCIITATNYADRIIKANPQYQGTWIVLTPEPTVIKP